MSSKNQQNDNREILESRIWAEEPEPDNPFVAAKCYCAGYDVYGDLLDKVGWTEYLYLLFKQERPALVQTRMLEILSLALANPGPRDNSVRAAMSASAGGSTAASSLMSALAVGAGQNGGAREVYLANKYWQECGTELPKWQSCLQHFDKEEVEGIWPKLEHPPGFDPYGVTCATPIRQLLSRLITVCGDESPLAWLEKNRCELEQITGYPLALTGVAAAAFFTLGFTPQESEMLFLLLRLPGAAAHALEQFLQWKKYPFFADKIELIGEDIVDYGGAD
ncbi:MAG: citryl-CoA lyase [Gammaproteobacteria bacterium]|nr:citryl-CoA lyase [Gammaproteobacteria bacterium]